jgi:hypothetical protein
MMTKTRECISLFKNLETQQWYLGVTDGGKLRPH